MGDGCDLCEGRGRGCVGLGWRVLAGSLGVDAAGNCVHTQVMLSPEQENDGSRALEADRDEVDHLQGRLPSLVSRVLATHTTHLLTRDVSLVQYCLGRWATRSGNHSTTPTRRLGLSVGPCVKRG